MTRATSNAGATESTSALPRGRLTSRRRPWRQFALITAAAIAIYVVLRLLPTGTNLNHMDFRVQGANALEMCDPAKPQFISVVEARSPVVLKVNEAGAPVIGEKVSGVVTLHTSSGKPVEPKDLLVVHTRLLHLMIVDPTLADYQHIHPEPTGTPGEWRFEFTPRLGGTYRLFADFTPIATKRGLYASADLEVPPGRAGPSDTGIDIGRSHRTPPSTAVERNGYRFSLVPTRGRLRAGEPIDFSFRITAAQDGAGVPLEPVMGAYAHLVAFDPSRTGFAHLHPMQPDPLAKPDAITPSLAFNLTIPKPGDYVIWAQVNLGGTEVFVPFAISVSDGNRD